MAEASVVLGELAEEFSGRVRRGEMPDVEEYARRHPELAERIRALFPTLMLLEGMAAGVPCVASRIPALEEVTDSGRVAVLADPRSPDSIADGILRLAGDPAFAAHLGSAAAVWARQQYDVTASMRRLEALYSSLVSGPQPKPQEARIGTR